MSKDFDSKELQELVDAFLKKGGKIKICGANKRTDADQIKENWPQKGRKKAEPKAT